MTHIASIARLASLAAALGLSLAAPAHARFSAAVDMFLADQGN